MIDEIQPRLIPSRLNNCPELNPKCAETPHAMHTDLEHVLEYPINNLLYRFVNEDGLVYREATFHAEGNLILEGNIRVVQKIKRNRNWYFLLQECISDTPILDTHREMFQRQFSTTENKNVIEVPWDPRPGERTPQEYFDRMIRYYENMFLDVSKSEIVTTDRMRAARAIVRLMDSELAPEIIATPAQNKIITRAREYNGAMEDLGWTSLLDKK